MQITKVQISLHMSRFVRKPAFCICENKDADQLRGDREADQRLCFRYIDSKIPLLSTDMCDEKTCLCLFSDHSNEAAQLHTDARLTVEILSQRYYTQQKS